MTRDRASYPRDITTSTPQRAPKAMLVPQLLRAGIEMLNVKLIYFSTLYLAGTIFGDRVEPGAQGGIVVSDPQHRLCRWDRPMP